MSTTRPGTRAGSVTPDPTWRMRTLEGLGLMESGMASTVDRGVWRSSTRRRLPRSRIARAVLYGILESVKLGSAQQRLDRRVPFVVQGLVLLQVPHPVQDPAQKQNPTEG